MDSENTRREDAARVKIAQALRTANENKVQTVEFIKYQSWVARQRYVELKHQGFNDEDALHLCMWPIQI